MPAQGTSSWTDSKTGLERIENKTYSGETVRLDGHFFENCVFENCLLSYGGELCEWNNSRFSNCRIILDGKANYTTQVLQALGFHIVAEDNSSSLQSAEADA